jgi:hypothetical protein
MIGINFYDLEENMKPEASRCLLGSQWHDLEGRGPQLSRRLPTVAARVRSQVRSCEICGGQSGTGAGYLLALRLPLPLIPPTARHSS